MVMYSLIAPQATFTRAHIQGGVTYTEAINTGDNITLGSCVASRIEFSVLDLNYAEMAHYAGVEFDFNTHDLLPYGFSENELLIAQNGERYNFPVNHQRIGKFTVQRPERLGESKWKFVGVDRMGRFDQIVDDWYGGLKFPITLKGLLESLCEYCGVELEAGQFPNDGFVVRKNFIGSGIKGRDILGWIAELAASFARITSEGKLNIAFYADKEVTVDRMSQIRVSDYEVHPVDKLQVKATEDDVGVIVGTGSNTYIIQANPLLITATNDEIRPAAETIFSQIKSLPIYTPLEVETYAEYADCRAGDIVSVKTRRGTYTTIITSRTVKGDKVTLFSVGAQTRQQVQSVNRSIQQIRGRTNEIVATVEQLSVTLTEYQMSTDGALTTLHSNVTQTAADITAEVERATAFEGTLSTKITQTATSITNEVKRATGVEDALGSRISQTADSLTVQINGQGGRISSLEVTLQGFTAAVGNTKLKFDETGLTCYRGGFRINNGKEDVFSVDSSGALTMKGSLVNVGESHSVEISEGNIVFYKGKPYPDGTFAGSIYGWDFEGKSAMNISAREISLQGNVWISGKINGSYWRPGSIYVPNADGSHGKVYQVITWS